MFRTICTQVVPLKRDDTDGDTAHDTPYDILRDTAHDTPYDTRHDTAHDTLRDTLYDIEYDTGDDTVHDTQCGHIPRLDQDQTKLRPDYNCNKTNTKQDQIIG